MSANVVINVGDLEQGSLARQKELERRRQIFSNIRVLFRRK